MGTASAEITVSDRVNNQDHVFFQSLSLAFQSLARHNSDHQMMYKGIKLAQQCLGEEQPPIYSILTVLSSPEITCCSDLVVHTMPDPPILFTTFRDLESFV